MSNPPAERAYSCPSGKRNVTSVVIPVATDPGCAAPWSAPVGVLTVISTGCPVLFRTWPWTVVVPGGTGGGSTSAHAAARTDNATLRVTDRSTATASHQLQGFGGDVMAHGDKRYNSRRWRELCMTLFLK